MPYSSAQRQKKYRNNLRLKKINVTLIQLIKLNKKLTLLLKRSTLEL